MDTLQFIAELVRIAAGLAWPITAVIIAKFVRDILNEPPAPKQQPKETPRDDRPRNPHPPPPTYPPRS